MSEFRIINSVNEIPNTKGWVNSTNLKKEIVDENGTAIKADHSGRSYQVVAKKKKEIVPIKRISRILLGLLLTSVSFGGALCFKKIKNLFTKKYEKIRFGLLIHQKVIDSQKNSSKTAIAIKTNGAKRVESKKEESPFYQASICITSEQMIGVIGDDHEKKFMPKYLTKLTLEKGDPLPMAQKDSCLEFYLFNTTDKTTFPEKIQLPLALFKGKKDGDQVRLRFEDRLIIFTINQRHGNQMYAEGTFEEVLARAIRYSETQIRAKFPNFDQYNEFWWVKPGARFKLDRGNQSLTPLQEESMPEVFSVNFQELKEALCLFEVEGNRLTIKASFPSFQSEDLEIILNEDHLIFYAKHKSEPTVNIVKNSEIEKRVVIPYSKFIKEIDENDPSFSDIDQKEYEKRIKQNELLKKRINSEMAGKFAWTRCEHLQGLNIEQFRDKVEMSKVAFEEGCLFFTINLKQ